MGPLSPCAGFSLKRPDLEFVHRSPYQRGKKEAEPSGGSDGFGIGQPVTLHRCFACYPNGDDPEGLITEQDGRAGVDTRASDLLIQRDASVYLF